MENIFDHAKKELSQDAVITCILKERDANAKEFIKSMLGSDCPAYFTIEEVQNQVSKIDVLVTIKVSDDNGEHYEAIIIEDKTNTFLHDDQLKKYVDAIANIKTINKIYFVLFKTGDYYFWERDMYKEMQSNYKPTHKKTIVYKEFLLNDFITFLSKANLKYGWIADYRAHMGKLKRVTWCTDLTKNSDAFVATITNGKWAGGSKNYEFGKAGGNGDKGYELWLQGLCGVYDPKTSKKPATAKNCYYLLPIISLQSPKKKFVLKFNMHLNLNPNSPHGYLPFSKCGIDKIDPDEITKYINLQKQVIKDYQDSFDENGFKINSRDSILQICSYTTVNSYDKSYVAAINELKAKLGFLIDQVNKIKNDIDNGKYDYCLL